MANVGKQIKRLRTARSMTQDELAEQLFVSRQTVSNYETGKSNPDIDMLVRIAQVFGTDVNCLIYGPPVSPDRKREKRRAVILAVVTAGLAALMAYLIPLAKDYTSQTLLVGPSYLLYYVGWPVLMFLTGWTVLDLAGGFLGARRLKGKCLKWGRWAFIGLLLFYGAMMAPFLIWVIRTSLSVLWQGSVSSSFRFPSVINKIWAWSLTHPGLFRAGFVLMGAGLWLTRREKQQEPAPAPEEPSEP